MMLLVGDPHAKNSNLPIMAELFAMVEATGLTTIWLGDLLDTKEVIRGKSLNAYVEYFSKSRLRHFVLVGNHDWFNLECEAHSLETLKLLPNVTVVDTPVRLQDGVTIPMTLIPYIHDRTKLRETLAQIPDGEVVVCHIDVADHDYGNGYLSKDGLKLEELSRFTRVISGHFHKFQETANLMYLGTPFTQSFGESDQLKYIATYDGGADAVQLYETTFRRHITVEVNCDVESSLPDAQQWATNDLYRLILTGQQENIDKFNRASLEGLNVKWITRPSDLVLNDVTIDETLSNEGQFQKWANDVCGLDAETIKLGMDILGVVR